MAVYPGPQCKSEGYTVEFLKTASPDNVNLTNGIALEMLNYSKATSQSSVAWIRLILRLSGYQGTITPKLLNTTRMALNRLLDKKKHYRRYTLDDFLRETYTRTPAVPRKALPKHLPPPSQTLLSSSLFPTSPSDSASDTSSTHLTNGFTSEDDSRGGHDQVCCLLDGGDRCQNQAGNASYSKRIQKTVQQRKLKLVRDDTVPHIYICDYHKNMIQRVRTKRKRKESMDGRGSPDADDDYPEIDFFQIPVNTLRRYKRHFKLTNRPGLNKSQLAEVVAKHFRTIHVNEKETTTYFFYMAKNYKNRLDQKGSDVGTN
ncbi:histone deacetylase complex subunit SAP30 homolog isoform X2 [Littorina saxatilis]|uniref:histone deacetylase complex subunit SAP30 homolog isoform X2 n=1 Tax=Littorina saxatilis TaxID=31220 RepID=UPI0038B5CA49